VSADERPSPPLFLAFVLLSLSTYVLLHWNSSFPPLLGIPVSRIQIFLE